MNTCILCHFRLVLKDEEICLFKNGRLYDPKTEARFCKGYLEVGSEEWKEYLLENAVHLAGLA